MGATLQSLPGYTTGRSVTPKEILKQASKEFKLQVPVAIDKSAAYDGKNTSYEYYIRGGCFLAESAGKFAPVKRTKANGAGSSSTSLTVDNAIHFKAGDSIKIGDNAAQAIVSINYGTNVITLTSAATWADNAPVYVDAWKTARGILLDDEVALWNADKSANVDKTAQMLVAGLVDQDELLGDVTAILEDYDSRRNLALVTFDDYQLNVDATPEFLWGGFGFRRAVQVDADYTVLASDVGTLFIATAAVNFTLPTKGANLWFGFYQTADANMAILSAGSADDIIATNDDAADSVTYSTASQKRGSMGVATILPDLTKWAFINVGGTTITVA